MPSPLTVALCSSEPGHKTVRRVLTVDQEWSPRNDPLGSRLGSLNPGTRRGVPTGNKARDNGIQEGPNPGFTVSVAFLTGMLKSKFSNCEKETFAYGQGTLSEDKKSLSSDMYGTGGQAS